MALLLALVAFLAACDLGPRGTTVPTATPTPAPALPPFSDWRVAYADADAALHAVTPDGKTDVTNGYRLADWKRTNGDVVFTSGFSPSGRLLSYTVGRGDIYLVDADTKPSQLPAVDTTAYEQRWSPDGSLLAFNAGPRIGVLRPSDGSFTAVPTSSSLVVTQVLGWEDDAHLVVIAGPPTTIPTRGPNSTPVSSGGPPPGPRSISAYVLDIASGALRPIATLTSATMGIPTLNLSPDGKTILYFNRPFRDYPFVPDVALIDVTSGAVRHLPRIASTAGVWYTGVAWLPGTTTIAVSQGFYLTGQFNTWLLDTTRDTATPLGATLGGATGWVPGTRTLILTSGTADSTITGVGPFTISAVPNPIANPQAAAVTLTTNAYTFPTLGFVRSA